jgi:hypothetical protein
VRYVQRCLVPLSGLERVPAQPKYFTAKLAKTAKGGIF